MQCDDVADTLAAAADGTALLSPSTRRHVDRCLRCQAEAAQYRKLLRAMRSLADDVETPPSHLVDDVLLAVDDDAERVRVLGHLRDHRAAYLGGLAASVAGVAGVAGAIVLARTRRAMGDAA